MDTTVVSDRPNPCVGRTFARILEHVWLFVVEVLKVFLQAVAGEQQV